MHHLLLHAAPSRIVLSRPLRKILVPEFAPHAHHLYPLGGIGLDKKCVSHSRKCYPNRLLNRSAFGWRSEFDFGWRSAFSAARKATPSPRASAPEVSGSFQSADFRYSNPCPAATHFASPSTPAVLSPTVSGETAAAN